MPEEVTHDTVDTTTAAATQAEIDWQKRYADLQPEYTRTTQALKDAESVWDDEQALLARIAEKHPHLLIEDEPEEEDTYEEQPEPKPDPRVDNLVAWQAEQQLERDINRFRGDRELSDEGRETVEMMARGNPAGFNAKSLEAAVNRYFQLTTPPDPEKPKPHATHVVANGAAVTDDVDPSELSAADLTKRMVERLHNTQT